MKINMEFTTRVYNRLAPLSPALVLLAFLPAMIFGVKYAHDIVHHLSWFFSFRDEFSRGVLYPRWLPTQFEGLGSPVYFFYPPFVAYCLTLFDLAAFKMIPANHMAGIVGFVMAAASFAGFYAWIRIFTSRNLAFLAATFYALAPYHLMVDYYDRSAFAEFAAYIWIPLVFAGIHKIVRDGKTYWAIALALSIAGLFFTHLLTALMIAPVAVVYTLILVKKTKPFLLQPMIKTLLLLAFSGITGVGLAAVYYIPALTMTQFIDFEALHWPVDGSFIYNAINMDFAGKAIFVKKLFVIATLYLVVALYLGYELFIARAEKPRGLFWLVVTAVIYLVMCGVFSFMFHAPSPYREIQFAWRFLVMAEFAIITGAAIILSDAVGHARLKRIAMIFGILVVTLLGVQAVSIAKYIYQDPYNILLHHSVKMRLSPREYYPPGSALSKDGDHRPQMISELEAYGRKPIEGSVITGQAILNKVERKGSTFTMTIDAKGPAVIALDQFYFPGWRATNEKGKELAITAGTPDKLVSFNVDKGQHIVTVERIVTPQEKTGKMISLGALFLFLILVLITGRKIGHEKI